MKKVILAAVIWLAFAALGLAQGGPDTPDCTLCIRRADTSCEAQANCNPGIDCVSTTFTVPCDTIYDVNSEMSCENGSDCKYCLSCVFISLSGTVIGASVTHNTCEENDCTGHSSIQLQTNKTYTLTVCKRLCEGANCAECDECTARGEVKFPGSTCPGW